MARQPSSLTPDRIGHVVDRLAEEADEKRRLAETRRSGRKPDSLPKLKAFGGGVIDSYTPPETWKADRDEPGGKR